ncbi:MAG: type II secretion system F family protein [Candidatus Aenigmatarchaeota archaeon]
MDEKNILIASVAVFIVTVVLAVFMQAYSFDSAISANIILLGIIVLFVPYSIYRFLEFRKINAYEKEFPAFLRDMSEAQRAGMSIIEGIRLLSKSEYGLLTHEIKKMNNELSWNVSLENVLSSFIKRMNRSKTITRSLMIIEQANKSGGNIEDTMDSLASNIEMIKDVQEEKATLMNQQIMMMYAIFFIFLGISIVLTKFLIPFLQTQSLGGVFGADPNPCYNCIEGRSPDCFSCDAFFAVSTAFDLGDKKEAPTYYKSLFLLMVIVQGIFSGLIIGQIGSDSIVAGIKHGMILLFSGLLIFILIVKIGII